MLTQPQLKQITKIVENDMNLNVLSLFDGIACGKVALERAGHTINKYYASEIDRHAIKIAMKNHPDIIQVGDITKLKGKDFKEIDIIIGGSPCQGFSFAGKQLNFEDSRSKLFFEFVRIVKEIKPKYFLLENVKMKKKYQDIISEYLNVQPIEINSSLVSAQNRKRLYWTNIPNITQPEDKGILLKHILESGVVDKDKSYCIDASYYKGSNLKQYIEKSRRQIVFTERRTAEAKEIRRQYREKFNKDFSPRRAKELVPREDNKCNILVTSLTKEHILLDESLHFRKLTPIECERLQTLPDNYTEGVGKSQRYKMLGNGWTIDVLTHIFKNIGDNDEH